MDQLRGSPISCAPSADESDSAGAGDPTATGSSQLPPAARASSQGTELNTWALGH